MQINTTVGSGSTGRIAEDIGRLLMNAGHDSVIAFGRGTSNGSNSKCHRIGSRLSNIRHGMISAGFDRHGFGSTDATKRFVNELKRLKPDIVHLHNIHGYYLNISVLFEFLRTWRVPVVWTLHDSWSYTGHCTGYETVGCQKWQSCCFSCPKKGKYPRSIFFDQSERNYHDKRALYGDMAGLHIVTPSNWLALEVKLSFLKNVPVKIIPNGVDVGMFRPREMPRQLRSIEKKIVLGVASGWSDIKGLSEFAKLATCLSSEYQIVLVGLSKRQMNTLPSDIIGIQKTENVEELAAFYSAADVFVNPTRQDNFPTTNIEALACGTPVITYDTGGSPEAINKETGMVVRRGDIAGLMESIKTITERGKEAYTDLCRGRALCYFDKNDRYLEYLHLYDELLIH